MSDKQTLHFAFMCNQSNGGFDSALTLIDAMRPEYDLKSWSLFGDVHPTNNVALEEKKITLRIAKPVAEISEGDHVFFYMNEYPTLFGNFENAWRQQLAKAGSVQFAFNRTVGNLPKLNWLSESLTRCYFQDDVMRNNWQTMTRSNQLGTIPCEILAPPVLLDDFLNLPVSDVAPLVIGRLAGDDALPSYATDLYADLALALPNAEFWFMPAPDELRRAFENNTQFRFLSPNEIPVLEFFKSCDIYLLTYRDGVPIPGPRSLVEAMAANCAPIVVNRDGPKLRVVDGESGYCAGSQQEFYDHTIRLAKDSGLRKIIAAAARERAQTFKVESWVTQINKTINRYA